MPELDDLSVLCEESGLCEVYVKFMWSLHIQAKNEVVDFIEVFISWTRNVKNDLHVLTFLNKNRMNGSF